MVIKQFHIPFLLLCLIILTSSCGSYKKSIMLQTSATISDSTSNHTKLVDGHYPILINDKIELRVYSNNGELLIDPNVQYKHEFIGADAKQSSTNPVSFLVEQDSTAYLPMIGSIKIVGYTKNELDSVLMIRYAEYYEQPFVLTKVVSRKVYIFGAIEGQEIYLEDENMNLLEVLALSGYEGLLGRSNDIKIVRGDVNNPEVLVVDLSTTEGMLKSKTTIFPNDVIYIQPRRKTFSEGMRDAAVFVGILTSTLTILILISR